jgi:hypothetical protein
MRVLKLLLNLMPRDKFIASYSDACIETLMALQTTLQSISHPTRVRVLKPKSDGPGIFKSIASQVDACIETDHGIAYGMMVPHIQYGYVY